MKQKPPLPDNLALAFEETGRGAELRKRSTIRTHQLEEWIERTSGNVTLLASLSKLDQLSTHVSKMHETYMLARMEAAAFYDLQEDDHQNPA